MRGPAAPRWKANTYMNRKSDTFLNILAFVVVAIFATVFWPTFKTALMFVVTLGVLVAIHEWGHFIAAKSAGVTVYEFAIGFGPRLITYMKRNGTDYTIRAFPLGGFVNPKGMQPDDPITPDGLNGRRPAERALVYLSGPLMNMILGAVILMLSGFLFGVPDKTKVLVGEVTPKKPGSRMEVVSVDGQPASGQPKGIRIGDRILEINGEPVKNTDEVPGMVHPHADKPITIKVLREGKELVLAGTPERLTQKSSALVVVGVPEGSRMGVQAGDQIDYVNQVHVGSLGDRQHPDVAFRKYLDEHKGEEVTLVLWRDGKVRMEVEGVAGPIDVQIKGAPRETGILGFRPTEGEGARVSLQQSVSNGLTYLRNFGLNMAHMFSKPAVLSENVGGPVRIAAILSEVDRLPIGNYFAVMASLSLSLAIFNLLPIPVLDGGHLSILTVEVLRRRRLEPETHKVVALFGLAIVGVLFVLILGKDLIRQFG